MPPERLVVHKFGGTSLAGAERYRAVAEIVLARPEPRRAMVVSAMAGVTDGLVRAVRLAGARDAAYEREIAALRERHRRTAAELLPPAEAESVAEAMERELADVHDVLRAAWILRHAPRGGADMVSGVGEVWSARLLAAYLGTRGAGGAWLDAREVLVAEPGETTARVDWPATRERLRAWEAARGGIPPMLVVTGFVASTAAGVPATLGRNGSDFSASIFGALLGADEIHIWTDVDGVMSANPRLVPEAIVLDRLSYREAMELAHFGARVVHPATMGPAVERGIPLYIRNTFRPDAPGTRIDADGAPVRMVKGLSTVEGVALLNLEGPGMRDVPGTAHRLFAALREAGVEPLMVSQGSSQNSICLAVPAALAGAARGAADAAFFAERHHGQVRETEVDADCCLLAVVGDGMAGNPGVAARFFGALGKAGVNIRAIAQGSSERNISVVVGGSEAERALRAAHAGLYLSGQTLSIGVIGSGVVGAALLDQLAARAPAIRRERNVDLRVRAICTSRAMARDDRGIALGGWRGEMARGDAPDLDAFAAHVQTEHLPHAVIVDCTADESIARRYAEWLRRGIHVVTPNKRANTLELDYYRQLRALGRGAGGHYLYETTVGAGLPIIQTLRDLIDTGDEVQRIEGVLSGTLSYLFNAFDGVRPFSELVGEARREGFTEPDPRDDLSGADVARKVVILGREMGLEMEMADVELEGLVPDGLRGGSVDDFLRRLGEHDEPMTRMWRDAHGRGERLRFVGAVERDGRATVRLRAYPATHAFARLNRTDNLVQFQTRRYTPNPLIVQGPGAGPEVTAGGVFADLLRLASYLGGAS
ncbi:bifunctional aspartate kinase/homoserine dehydrogenase I [Longimicrobium sp.]|uniref:bifunctional aspartate kinase/homoserine dehydrogenase I n=1 Tax=Longimicrobium sp. TaxID=2029185 RepID=UPI002BB28188|nr:bifunctional aspartate kinase/homoserine dehydrogenase I [Longimicrobium sp.]HSU15843.1 bifunctional aspartate kinase/homoserine dehydrogenase I [Longimicrobium sp.]